MSKLSFFFATLTFAVALGAAGCEDSIERCPDGECPVIQPPGSDDDDSRPAPCADACKNLLGECDATAAADGIDQCERHCRAELSDAETACLAELSCGDPADHCLD
jgi:hypothetical protein